MSLIDPTLTKPIQPTFSLQKHDPQAPPDPGTVQPKEPAGSIAIISALAMIPHTEVNPAPPCLLPNSHLQVKLGMC